MTRTTIRFAPIVTATLVAFASVAASAATTTATQEDSAQLKADQSSLMREEAKAAQDEAKLHKDKQEGRMAAQSKDSMRVYHDQQNLKGIKKDIASDHPASAQLKEDRKFQQTEQAKLKTDQQRLVRDRKEGRMAAVSPDEEKVYHDRQAIKGQKKAVAADEANLRKDQH